MRAGTSRRLLFLPLLIQPTLLLTACGSIFGDCRSERIEISLPATIEQNGAQQNVTLGDAVSVGNLSVNDFEILRAVLTGHVASQDQGVIWTVPLGADGWVSLAIDPPISAGTTLTVGSTYDGAGWGLYSLPGVSKVAASVHDGAFAATSVTGTVEVLGVEPLRLRLDLDATDAASTEVRVQGDATFTFISEPAACT